ncbi:MAG: sulfotransferase [Gammaproteobacteria bacterium]
MRLPRPFYRLPVRFDTERLVTEVRALPESAWAPHPNAIKGNSSVRLISVDGGENDDVMGRMLPTSHLLAAPYLRQVLASFGVVWSRSRLMRLAPGASVPLHADINYHWFTRVRVHIPVLTRPEVSFHCGDHQVHMATGEAWLFDNWRLHRVENPAPAERIHLVADTSGSAPFWRLAAQADLPATKWHQHHFDPTADARPLTEINSSSAVMPATEVELLLRDLGTELVQGNGDHLAADESGQNAVNRYHLLLEEFCHDWRQLCALHGLAGDGLPDFRNAAEALRAGSHQFGINLVMRTNGVAAHRVLEARVLQHLLPTSSPLAARRSSVTHVRGQASPTGPPPGSPANPLLESPVFIVAAPRSGSSLLFETLAAHGSIATLGGEAHWLIEGLPALKPGAPGIDSNRLTAADLNPDIAATIRHSIVSRLRDSGGQPVPLQSDYKNRGASGPDHSRSLQFLEKTPKNALRIPFFHALFPAARFIFLWRDPRENISSIIEAWRSGGFITYPTLPGRDDPWSMLLPPQWQLQRGRPVEEIAAWQWDSTNRFICDDLAAVPREQWTVVRYDELLASTTATVDRLCAFMGMKVDTALAARLATPLPLSRYTRTPPAPDKWRRNADLIERILPDVATTWHRLDTLR